MGLREQLLIIQMLHHLQGFCHEVKREHVCTWGIFYWGLEDCFSFGKKQLQRLCLKHCVAFKRSYLTGRKSLFIYLACVTGCLIQ